MDVQVLPARLVKRIAERKDLDGFRQNPAFGCIDKSDSRRLLDSLYDEVAVGDKIFRGSDVAPPHVFGRVSARNRGVEMITIKDGMTRIVPSPGICKILPGKDNRVRPHSAGQIQRGCGNRSPYL